MKLKSSDWYRNRGYLHFDQQVGIKAAQAIVTNPKKVARHSFYPMLRYCAFTIKLGKAPEDNSLVKNHKAREITYASHLDSHIYAYYGKVLELSYEQILSQLNLSNVILAFRRLGKSNVDFAYEAFKEIESRKDCDVIALDITGFFDNLDHQHIKDAGAKLLHKDQLPEDHYAVYRSLTRYAYCLRDEIYKEFEISLNNPWHQRKRICSAYECRSRVREKEYISINNTDKGIPQGTAISALLSNIFMLNFDQKLHSKMNDLGGSYRRYCDDMLFILPKSQQFDVESFVASEIEAYGLSINSKKTEKRLFRDGVSNKALQYLGFTYDGKRILLRSAALARFSEKMNKSIRLVKNTVDKESKKMGFRVPLRRKKLYERYSHLGHRNFITYGLRASAVMNSKAIRKQIKPLWDRLNQKLDEVDQSAKDQ